MPQPTIPKPYVIESLMLVVSRWSLVASSQGSENAKRHLKPDTSHVGRYYRQTSQLPQASMTEPSTKYEPRLHVVLHQPEIPYNTGSVGRTCVAVGAKLWLVRPLGFRVDDYYLRRAGLDYWEHLEWQVVDNWGELQASLGSRR